MAGTQNELVEFAEEGSFVATYQLDSGALGAAFGIADTPFSGEALRFAAVDDDLNAVTIWNLRSSF